MGRLKGCLFKVLTVRRGKNRKRCWTVLRVQHLFLSAEKEKKEKSDREENRNIGSAER